MDEQASAEPYAAVFARVNRWIEIAEAAGAAPTIVLHDAPNQIVIGSLLYTIELRSAGYLVLTQERNDPTVDGVFGRFDDMAKYLIAEAGDRARRQLRLPPKDSEWDKLGMDPRVEVEVNGYDRTLSLPGEPDSTVTMSYIPATVFSHILPLTIEELEAELREGIPESYLQ